MKRLVLSVFLIAAVSFADVDREALRKAPGSLTKENTPQFIVLGSDDNTKAAAVKWMQSVVDGGTNKNGSKRYMSFYCNTDQTAAEWDLNENLVEAVYAAYKAGHEIGNHTSTHIYCVEYGNIDEDGKDNGNRASEDVIKNEVQRVQDILVKAGIPKEHQTGFRTPYLRYSDSTFSAIEKVGGFLYDCSISAASDNKAGTNFFPYKIDMDDGFGNFTPDNSKDFNSWGITSVVKEHKNLWELPCVNYAIDPQDMDYVRGVLDDGEFDGYITGLDYNLWEEAKLDSAQTVRAWMHTLNESLKGNRAPFTFGCHSQYYFEAKTGEFPYITPEQRQGAFEKFVEEASKLDNVFFVSGDMVIRWMQNPVKASEFNPENYKRTKYTAATTPTAIKLSSKTIDAGTKTVGNLRAVDLDVSATHTFTIKGGADAVLFAIDGNKLSFKDNAQVGQYSVEIEANNGKTSISETFGIKVNKAYSTNENLIGGDYEWWDEYDEHEIGSDCKITAQEPLTATLTMGISDEKTGKWAWVSVATEYKWSLLGLKRIEITYTSDKALQIGTGQWLDGKGKEKGEYYGYGFAAPLSKTGTSEEVKTAIIYPEDFDWSYSEASDNWKGKLPKSFEDALPRVNEISISAVEDGVTNIVIKSLRLIGVTDDTEPVNIIVPTKKLASGKGISFNGVSGKDIRLDIVKAGVYHVEIFTVNGKRVFSQKNTLSAGINSVAMPKNLAKGIAVIRVSGLNASLEQKLMIK
ncbi:MAG: polysaccharide deacetylase family protein [Chitinispirillales bacterium]|jgi:peptidoglycan/xylan/chitin deacetylase (PgdA/CDA1 family)|nr:polysaccharide deacetylase family protein [Chitinispirillales bacterium]